MSTSDMKTKTITVKKEVTEKIQLPQFFVTDIPSYYKIFEEDYMVVTYRSIAVLPIDFIKMDDLSTIIPVTEKEFLAQYKDTLKTLNNYKLCNQ